MNAVAAGWWPQVRVQASRRAPWLAPLIVLVVALRAVNPFPVGVLYDDAVYVELARALATGQGYRYLHMPGSPLAAHFPPGYPFFLSLLWRVWPSFPENVELFKIANAVLVAAIAVGLAVWAYERFHMSALEAAGLSVIASLGVPTLVLSSMVLSETLFLAVALAALILGERVVAGEQRVSRIVLAAVVAGAATLVRTHGVALIGAVVVLLLVRRRLKAAAWYAGISALFVLPWQLWVHVHAGAVPPVLQGIFGSYRSWWMPAWAQGGFGFLSGTMAQVTRDLLPLLMAPIAPVQTHAVGVLALLVAVALAAIGAWSARRKAPVTLLFLGLYFCVVLCWPYMPTRFVWCVWPLLVAMVLAGLRTLWNARGQSAILRRVRLGLLAASVIPLVGYARATASGYTHSFWDAFSRPRAEQVLQVAKAVDTYVPPGARIAAFDDVALFLYTGRQGVLSEPYAAASFLHGTGVSQLVDVLRELLKAYPLTHVVALRGGEADAARQLAAGPSPVLALRDSFPAGYIYSVIQH